ncbi:hypothetical protein C9374_014591 [Naegleria lovaniensis]|uniref:FH2 domain-containing protein n=1 Tax=Naegleria lovaniensis TaxID=51637 RepID=A0AA88GVJ0_NAELO|nr:uncharacterized protein C9374_014591 [Naegleria lovaniensis]KAG2389191.1 hypothetical protein C9374_014591 [Naegleria lovaniensis]
MNFKTWLKPSSVVSKSSIMTMVEGFTSKYKLNLYESSICSFLKFIHKEDEDNNENFEQWLKDKYGDIMLVNFTRQYFSNPNDITGATESANITEITTLSSISHFERITYLFEMCKTMYNFITKTTKQGVIVVVANAQYTCFALLLISSFLTYIEDNEFRSKRMYRTTLEAYYELKKFVTEKPISKVIGSFFTKQQLDTLTIFEPSVVRYCKFFNYLTKVSLPEVEMMNLESISLSTLDVFKKDANRKIRQAQQEELLSFSDPFNTSNIYFVIKQNNQIIYSTYGTQAEHISNPSNNKKQLEGPHYQFSIQKNACKLIGDFILFGYQMDELGAIQQLFRYTYNTLFLCTQDNGNILTLEKNRLDWAHSNNEIVDSLKIQLRFSYYKSDEEKVNSYKMELDSTVKSCPYYLKGNKVAIRLAHVTNQTHRRNMKGLLNELEVFSLNKETLLKKVDTKSPHKRSFSQYELDMDNNLSNIFDDLCISTNNTSSSNHLFINTKLTPLRSSNRIATPDTSAKKKMLLSPVTRRGSGKKVGTPSSKRLLSPMIKEQQLLHFTPPSQQPALTNSNKENENIFNQDSLLLDLSDPVFDELMKSNIPPPPPLPFTSKPVSNIPPPPMMGNIPPPPPVLKSIDMNVPPPPPGVFIPQKKNSTSTFTQKEEDNNIKKLHWQPIKVINGNSVWSNTSVDEIKLDLSDFQKMFAKEDTANTSTKLAPKTPSVAQNVASSVLDMGTNRNVEIILNSLKSLTNQQIMELINILDTNVLTAQHVENLKRLCNVAFSLASKKKDLESKGELLRTEQFLLDLLNVKNVEAKLNVIGYMHNLDAFVDSLTTKIKRKQEAIRVVRTSSSFAKVLKYVLTVGNYMNRGRRQLEANGFHISILPKLVDTKSSAAKDVTLMHYLVGLLEKDDLDVYCFEKELENCGACTFGVSITMDAIDTLFREYRQIHNQINYLHEACNSDERELYQTRLHTFHANCSPLLATVSQTYETLKHEYLECCEYFHFSPSNKVVKTEEDEFFSYIKEFTVQYKKAKKDVEQKKMMEMKAALQQTNSLAQTIKKRKMGEANVLKNEPTQQVV